MLDIKQKVEYDGKNWVVCQIQPDHQLACLQSPTDPQVMTWVRCIGRDLIPYDITEGRPSIMIPQSTERVLEAMSRQQHGNEGKPRR